MPGMLPADGEVLQLRSALQAYAAAAEREAAQAARYGALVFENCTDAYVPDADLIENQAMIPDMSRVLLRLAVKKLVPFQDRVISEQTLQQLLRIPAWNPCLKRSARIWTTRRIACGSWRRFCLTERFRPQEQVSAFDDAVNLLRQSYEALCRAAERLLPEEELPDAQALKDGTDGPGAILAAIECENKDADQGLALCDRVADYYPGHVYTSVVADKYYIDAEILKAVQAQAKEAPGPEQPDEAEASGAQQEPETAAFIGLLLGALCRGAGTPDRGGRQKAQGRRILGAGYILLRPVRCCGCGSVRGLSGRFLDGRERLRRASACRAANAGKT